MPLTALAQAEAPSKAEAFQRFEAERLLLLDHRGKAIGPAAADFPQDDLGIFNEQRFHVVHAGDLRYRLSFEEFMQLTQYGAFEQRWDTAQRKVKRHRGASIGLLVAGGVLAAGGLLMGSLAFANGEGDLIYGLPLLFSASTGFFVGGGAYAASAKRKGADLASQNLEVLSDRDEAWVASGAYNDALWRALSLGDSPPEPGGGLEGERATP
jgi:hypothetical protein